MCTFLLRNVDTLVMTKIGDEYHHYVASADHAKGKSSNMTDWLDELEFNPEHEGWW